MKLQGVGADTIKCVDFIYLAPVKRETGENPVRTRHRNQGVMTAISLGNWEDGQSDDL